MNSILKPVLGSQLQLGHPLAHNLVGLWLFNEGTGNKVFDLSGNGGNGIVNVFTWSASLCGTVLSHFLAENQEIKLPAAYKPLDGVSAFTIRLRFNLDTIVGDSGLFYTDAHTGSDAILIWLDNAVTNHIAVVVNGSGGGTGTDYSTETSGIIAGSWYDLIVTYQDGYDVRLYLNGIEDTGFDGSGASGTVLATDTQYHIGNENGLNKDFKGWLDYTMIWNRALSAAEIARLYVKPFSMFDRDLIELWSAATLAAPPVGMAGAMTTNTGYWGW